MKTTAQRMVLGAMVIAHTLKSQNNRHKYYLEAQLSNGVQHSSFVSGVGGAFGVFVNRNSSIDFRAKEVYNFSDQNIIGSITLNYRYNFSCGFYMGGGFAHHHEVGHSIYMDHPMESAMGSARGIFHRTGLDAEAGYNFKPLGKKGFFSVIYPTAGVTLTQMFMDSGQNPLITANLGIKVGIRKLE